MLLLLHYGWFLLFTEYKQGNCSTGLIKRQESYHIQVGTRGLELASLHTLTQALTQVHQQPIMLAWYSHTFPPTSTFRPSPFKVQPLLAQFTLLQPHTLLCVSVSIHVCFLKDLLTVLCERGGGRKGSMQSDAQLWHKVVLGNEPVAPGISNIQVGKLTD